MAATGNSQAERISRWDSLISSLEADLEEMPQFGRDLATLRQMLIEARDLEHRQDDLRSQVRDLNDVLFELLRQGDKVRRRIGAGLNMEFGFTSEKLVKYGFKPRRFPVRRRNPQTPEPPTAPPAAPKSPAPEEPR